MNDKVSHHYGSSRDLADKIAGSLCDAGENLDELTTADLSAIDEFHFRGRTATLQLAEKMKLDRESNVLDIGSGLGGPARTLAEEYGCHVTGIDLTKEFCDVAGIMSKWVNLDKLTVFRLADATKLPFEDQEFDAAMSIHVSMNIANKLTMYQEARRILKPGGIFAVYDILQGEGGDALFPAPWARDPSISHLATPQQMEELLARAGFTILDVDDSSVSGLEWLESRPARLARTNQHRITTQILFGEEFSQMVRNQAIGLRERRIRLVSYVCMA